MQSTRRALEWYGANVLLAERDEHEQEVMQLQAVRNCSHGATGNLTRLLAPSTVQETDAHLLNLLNELDQLRDQLDVANLEKDLSELVPSQHTRPANATNAGCCCPCRITRMLPRTWTRTWRP